jgi:hypothetical protein
MNIFRGITAISFQNIVKFVKYHALCNSFGFTSSNKASWNSEFHVLNSKFRVLNFKFHVPNSKFHVLNSKFHVLNSKFHVLNSKFHVLNSKFHVLNSKFRVPSSNHLHRSSINRPFNSKRVLNLFA